MADVLDLAVLGAGPAGIAAALAAAECGLSVAILDENAAPGGQVHRAPPPAFRPDAAVLGPDFAEGERLRASLAAAPVRCILGARVWMAGREDEGFRLDYVAGGTGAVLAARGLVLATGTHERVVPFPGWTAPGVIGLAAATILLKAQGVLPGRRTVVAGAGPLLAVVAAGILKGGGEVAALVDLDPRRAWLAELPRLAVARPDLVARGAGWIARLLAAGVPILSRQAVVAAETDAEGRLAAVLVAQVDAGGRPRAGAAPRRIAADALAVGHGLVPDTALTRLLRARHHYLPEQGGWVAARSADLALDLPGGGPPCVWLAGDGGGIAGAAAALHQGRLAGLAAARALGALDEMRFRALATPVRAALGRASRFGAAMARRMALREGLVAAIPVETVVCRCEDVTRADIEAAVAEGVREVNQLKQWTRCGMGPCQGRMCGEAAATLVGLHCGGREAAGMWTGRVPLRPVPLSAVLGEFDYADIPIPRPAPI